MMTTSDIVPEIRIEECINDIVEHFWDNLTGDDEFVDEKLEDLAAHLGIECGDGYKMNIDVEKYQELYGRIVKAAWVGLLAKIGQELGETMQNDLDGDFT